MPSRSRYKTPKECRLLDTLIVEQLHDGISQNCLNKAIMITGMQKVCTESDKHASFTIKWVDSRIKALFKGNLTVMQVLDKAKDVKAQALQKKKNAGEKAAKAKKAVHMKKKLVRKRTDAAKPTAAEREEVTTIFEGLQSNNKIANTRSSLAQVLIKSIQRAMKEKFPTKRHIIFSNQWIQGRYKAFKQKSVSQVQKDITKAKIALLTKKALEAKALHEANEAKVTVARTERDKQFETKVKSKIEEGKQIKNALYLSKDKLEQAGVFIEESGVLAEDACRGGITPKLYRSVARLDVIVLAVARKCISEKWAQDYISDPKRQPVPSDSSSARGPLPDKVTMKGHEHE
jgi:hypothetical protein